MADATSDPMASAGQQLQDKYELYSLTLTFTTLAAATQTAHFGVVMAADIVEIVAWTSLLLSGLTAMYRLERKPGIYHLLSRVRRFEALRDSAQQAVLGGSRQTFVGSVGAFQDTEKYLEDARESARKLDVAFETQSDRIAALWRAHTYTLFGGITLLVVARAAPAILSIVHRLRN